MEMMTLSVYFVKMIIVRRYHAYQSVSVAVSKKLPGQGRELTARIYLQLQWWQASWS